MTSITALFNQKHSLNVICVFTLILLEVGQQHPLQIKIPYRAGVRTRALNYSSYRHNFSYLADADIYI